MSYYNLELPKFLDVQYLPDGYIPGFLGIECLFEEEVGWEIVREFHFQYLNGEVFFIVFGYGGKPIPYPLGKASNLEDAIEAAKQFLKKWIGHDPKDFQFQSETANAIFQLEMEEERKRKGMSVEEMEELKRKIAKGTEKRIAEIAEQNRKKSGEG